MSDSGAQKVNRNKLPWFYRLILKIPGTDFIESSGGIFWGVVVPVFVVLEFLLSLFLILSFPFPANIVLVGIIPTAVLMIFLRISLGRFLNWWNSTFGESRFEWNVEKTLEEYYALLEKKKQKTE